MFNFFKKSKSKTKPNHRHTNDDPSVQTKIKTDDQGIPKDGTLPNKINEIQSTSRHQNDAQSVSVDENNQLMKQPKKNNIFTEIMAKGRNRRNNNNNKKYNQHNNNNNNNSKSFNNSGGVICNINGGDVTKLNDDDCKNNNNNNNLNLKNENNINIINNNNNKLSVDISDVGNIIKDEVKEKDEEIKLKENILLDKNVDDKNRLEPMRDDIKNKNKNEITNTTTSQNTSDVFETTTDKNSILKQNGTLLVTQQSTTTQESLLHDQAADFVKQLVLEKYNNRSQPTLIELPIISSLSSSSLTTTTVENLNDIINNEMGQTNTKPPTNVNEKNIITTNILTRTPDYDNINKPISIQQLSPDEDEFYEAVSSTPDELIQSNVNVPLVVNSVMSVELVGLDELKNKIFNHNNNNDNNNDNKLKESDNNKIVEITDDENENLNKNCDVNVNTINNNNINYYNNNYNAFKRSYQDHLSLDDDDDDDGDDNDNNIVMNVKNIKIDENYENVENLIGTTITTNAQSTTSTLTTTPPPPTKTTSFIPVSIISYKLSNDWSKDKNDKIKKKVTFKEGLISLPDIVKSTTPTTVIMDSDYSDDEEEETQSEEEEDDDEVELDEVELEEVDESDEIEGSIEVIENNIVEYEDDEETDEDDDEEDEEEGEDSENEEMSEPEDESNLEMRDLVNQESKYNGQLEEADKQTENAQKKLEQLQYKIDDLEREQSMKSWNVDRLQAELLASYKEIECMRIKLRHQEEEMSALRNRGHETEEELNQKYIELEAKYQETLRKLTQVQNFCSTLQVQLAQAQSDAENCRKEKERLIEERSEEQKIIEVTLDGALQDKSDLELKWKREFEQLRNFNSDREEHLLEDCEWQLRTMQKTCKEKIEVVEKEKTIAQQSLSEMEKEMKKKTSEVMYLRSFETEVGELRRLTNEQHGTLMMMTSQIEELRTELETATLRCEIEIENMKKMKWKCEMEIYDNQRHTLHKIEEETMAIACQWETKLLDEMTRLTNELTQIHGEERQEAVEEIRAEFTKELKEMKTQYDDLVKLLREEIASLKSALKNKHNELEDVQTRADTQLVQARMFLERADREHQQNLDKECEEREIEVRTLKEEHEQQKSEMEERFMERLKSIKEEFATEITNTKEELINKHKHELESQWKHLVTEKEDAIQSLGKKHRKKLGDAEQQVSELETSNQRYIEELRSARTERCILEQRDMTNSKEIETMHRKCRCLTNLFEEMRMRYERRDPRPEDIRQISELKNRIELQEQDLHNLTERLREFQIGPQPYAPPRKVKVSLKKDKPIVNQRLTNCDVIYEEIEPEQIEKEVLINES